MPPQKIEKHKNTKKMSFSVISQHFLFWGDIQKVFFDNLARKRAPKKHNKNGGFSKEFFEKQICVTKRPFLDKQIPNPEISVIIVFCFLLLFQQQETPKLTETLIFIVFSQLSKIQNFRLKQKNLFLHPCFEKKNYFKKIAR